MINVAYIGVIIIWTTTPLAIQWSSGEYGFIFAVTARMALGLAVLGLVFILMNYELKLHKKAIHVYLLSGVSIFCR